jgi:hypothetical protein
MYRACSRIGGLVTVLALAGCGESAPETGTVPYKSTQSPAIEGLSKQMADQAKKGAPLNKKEETPKAASEAKPADAKPAAGGDKAAEPKKD